MARTIVITSKHDLGIDGAKTRISDRFEVLKTSYMDKIGAADLTWDGNVGRAWATSLGQKGSAVIEIEAHALKIEITLPWLLSPMAGLLESIIKGNADALAPGNPTPANAPT